MELEHTPFIALCVCSQVHGNCIISERRTLLSDERKRTQSPMRRLGHSVCFPFTECSHLKLQSFSEAQLLTADGKENCLDTEVGTWKWKADHILEYR